MTIEEYKPILKHEFPMMIKYTYCGMWNNGIVQFRITVIGGSEYAVSIKDKEIVKSYLIFPKITTGKIKDGILEYIPNNK